jgi:hypothetical protein
MDHLRALRILGLPPGANADDIRSAWRDLAKVWHPDRFAHDERLRQKAGDNLGRINQAYETLRDYDPASTPRMAARVRESVAIILGMGELGEPPPMPARPDDPDPPPAMVPRGPIGLRRSLRVLGLGRARPGDEPESGAGLILAVILVLLVLAAVVFLTA